MPRSMRLLVSVRSVEEALVAAGGGADFIDLKEPGEGALGGLPVDTIREIVAALRRRDIDVPVSATIGDVAMDRLHEIRARVTAVGECGVDYVKVGIDRPPHASGVSQALGVLDALAASSTPVVPVLLVDRGLDAGLLRHACALGFEAIMVDTANKSAGSLLDVLPRDDLARFIACVREAGALAGVAGALRVSDLPKLCELNPDFAGFRSAVCAGQRGDALDPRCLHDLVSARRQCVSERD